jgi:hypothetical protein
MGPAGPDGARGPDGPTGAGITGPVGPIRGWSYNNVGTATTITPGVSAYTISLGTVSAKNVAIQGAYINSDAVCSTVGWYSYTAGGKEPETFLELQINSEEGKESYTGDIGFFTYEKDV